MAEQQQIREVVVYLPTGQAIAIPGDKVRMGSLGALIVIEELLEDGAIRRYMGLPHSVTVEPPSLVKPVGRGPLVIAS